MCTISDVIYLFILFDSHIFYFPEIKVLLNRSIVKYLKFLEIIPPNFLFFIFLYSLDSPLDLIQVKSRRRRVLDEVLVGDLDFVLQQVVCFFLISSVRSGVGALLRFRHRLLVCYDPAANFVV